MRVVVTGKSGQVAMALLECAAIRGIDAVGIGRPALELTDIGSIGRALEASGADVIVSAAAHTAVDRAESEPELAHAINAEAAGEIARTAARMDVPLIHLSTDYVFDGSKATLYVEDDRTAPLGVYGQSKLAGEEAVRAAGGNHVILRTAWVYSPFGSNFVKSMLRLAETRPVLRVVSDQRGAPTSALDIADSVLTIAAALLAEPGKAELRGTFHLTGSGEASWAEFAAEIFRISAARGGPAAEVEPIPSSEYPTPAARPANSRLSLARLKAAYGIVMPDWRTSTEVVVKRLLAGAEQIGQ